MKYLFFILLLIFWQNSFAQESTYYQKVKDAQAKGTINIDPQILVGNWIATDSTKNTLHFTWNENHIESQMSNGNVFKFYRFNHLKSKTVLGTLYRWPTQHCIISLLENNIIEIEFFDLREKKLAHHYKKI